MTFSIEIENLILPFTGAQIPWGGFDIDKHGNWLAITETKSGLRLLSPGSDIALPIDRPYAAVRCLGDKALVICTRVKKLGTNNAWIIDPYDGTILSNFSVGDAVQDIYVLKTHIAVSYFDEGLGFGLPSSEGIAVFDHSGAYLWGYRSGVRDAVDIFDCYAMCPAGPERIVFCAYTAFDFVELDLITMTQTITPTPEALHRCSAITFLKDTAFFRGPYSKADTATDNRDTVFAFDLKTHGVVTVGSLPANQCRGLSNGRMLCAGDQGMTVASFTAYFG